MRNFPIFFCLLMPLFSWTQHTEIPIELFDKADLLILATVLEAYPDVIQDDVGTAYGVLTVSCTYSYDLKSKTRIRCVADTLWGLTYLSTERNTRTIQLKKGINCFIFIKFTPEKDCTENRQLLLYDEKAIFLVNKNTNETIMKNIPYLRK